MTIELSGAFAEPMPKEAGIIRSVKVLEPHGAIVRTTPSKAGAAVGTIKGAEIVCLYPNHRVHDFVGVAIKGRFGYVAITSLDIEGYDTDRGIFREPAAEKPRTPAKRKSKAK